MIGKPVMTTYGHKCTHQDAQIRNLQIILNALLPYAPAPLWWRLWWKKKEKEGFSLLFHWKITLNCQSLQELPELKKASSFKVRFPFWGILQSMTDQQKDIKIHFPYSDRGQLWKMVPAPRWGWLRSLLGCSASPFPRSHVHPLSYTGVDSKSPP